MSNEMYVSIKENITDDGRKFYTVRSYFTYRFLQTTIGLAEIADYDCEQCLVYWINICVTDYDDCDYELVRTKIYKTLVQPDGSVKSYRERLYKVTFGN